jgi:hypothetical protein
MSTETIGFIGVGLMGHGMAKNIVEKGYPLTVMGHRNRAPVEDLLKRGAKEAKSAKEIGAASSIVFLCVTGSREVEAVVRGADGLVAGLKPGSIIVDCSTSDPTSTMALAEELKRGKACSTQWLEPLLKSSRVSSRCSRHGRAASSISAIRATAIG